MAFETQLPAAGASGPTYTGVQTDPYTGDPIPGGWQQPQQPTNQLGSADKGFSIFGWHPSLPNLGGITAIKQLASGFISLPEQAYHLAHGELTNNPDESTGVISNFAKGLGQGAEDLATSVAGVAGVPFTRFNAGDEILGPALQRLNAALPGMHQTDAQGNDVGFKPSSFYTRPGGPIAGLVQDISMGATVATGVGAAIGAPAAATAATETAEAADAAEATAQATGDAADIEKAAQARQAAEEAASNYSTAQKIANTAAHPYKFMGSQLAGLVDSAWSAAHPGVGEAIQRLATPADVANGLPTQAVHEDQQSKVAAAFQGLQDLSNSETAGARAGARSDEMTTLYRGSDNPEVPGANGSWWTTAEPTNRQGYANWQSTQVPTSALDELRGAAQDAAHRGEGQPRPNIDVYLDPNAHGDWLDAAQPFRPGERLNVPTGPHVSTDAEGKLNVTESVRPAEAKDEATQALRAQEDQARAINPDAGRSAVADAMAARLMAPPPAWAQRLTSILPDSVNRVLGALEAPLSRQRFQQVVRDFERHVEISQRGAMQDPAVRSGIDAATALLQQHIDGVDRFTASKMIGEEIAARINGTQFAAELIKDGSDPAVAQAMRDWVRQTTPGIPLDVWDKLNPDAARQIEQGIHDSVEAYHTSVANRLNTLLQSSQGARGLEQALLGSDTPGLSASQVKLYRRAMNDLRRADVLRNRDESLASVREASFMRQSLLADKAHAEAGRLQALVGLSAQTANDLHTSIAIGARAENIEQTITDVAQAVARDGYATWDIGHGARMIDPTAGYRVAVAHLWDGTTNDFAANYHDVLKDAILNPTDANGLAPGVNAWSAQDARLTARQYMGEDGLQHIALDMTMSTWAHQPISLPQAMILGEAYANDTITSFADGKEIQLSSEPYVQNLWANYAGQALDPKSDLSRMVRQLSNTAENTPRIDPKDIEASLRATAMWDYALSRTNPREWAIGDYFKNASVMYAKGLPNGDALLKQTVLGMSSADGAQHALATMTQKQVSDALAWYYDSHDYIEQMYRGKPVTLLNGEQRDAADVMYDLIAVTSVMASPKQNLGRALMAMSNMSDFMAARGDAFKRADSLMSRIMKTPNNSVRIAGLGTEDERLVREGGTSISRRFANIQQVRDLTEGTSMTNQPKYNVFDILSGRLKLAEADTPAIANLPEFWTGTEKSLSDNNLPRSEVMAALDRNGAAGPARDRLNAADARLTELNTSAPFGKDEDKPILASENEDTGSGDNVSRKVTPEEYRQLSKEGNLYLAARGRSGGDINPVLDSPEMRHQLFEASQGEWGGGTIDTHTVQPVPEGDDSYAVTIRQPGVKTVDIPIGSNEARFNAAYSKALKQFGDQLKLDGAHLGVFHNVETGKIEIDPVLVTRDTHEVEAVGAASHAQGGAYHFSTGNGYWVPHVDDAFASKANLARSTKDAKIEWQAARHDPAIKSSYDQALMEYHGSKALAKLRSFRENLAHPDTSLAVTLDSVMGQLYGYGQTFWGGADNYATHAAEVRDVANQMSAQLGRDVKPHEVQALLWVYAKTAIGSQDWGRLLAHHDMAQSEIDTMEKLVQGGKAINPKDFHPLGDYYEEELGQSREAANIRSRITDLSRTKNRTAAEDAELAQLRQVDLKTPRSTDVMVTQPRTGPEGVAETPTDHTDYHWEERKSIPFDRTKLTRKEGQYATYLTTEKQIQNMLAENDFEGARKALTSYVAGLERSVRGDTGGSFQVVGEETRRAEQDSAHIAEQNLLKNEARSGVPAPRPWGAGPQIRGGVDELHDEFLNRIRGALSTTADKNGRLWVRLYHGAAFDTLLHENAHLLRQILPADMMSQLREHYPAIEGAMGSAARNADEERFVSDMMYYMRNARREGAQLPGAQDIFAKVGATMEEHLNALRDSQLGRSIPQDVSEFWDRMFNPEIQRPDKVADPLNMEQVKEPRGVETKQYPWETQADFAQRARQYGEARARTEAAQYKADLARRAAANADGAARRMYIGMTQPSRYAELASKSEIRAHAALEKLAQQVDVPDRNQVPRQLQPMWDAFTGLKEMVKVNPALAEYVDEIPATFSDMMIKAAEHGFQPEYLPDMTWEKAQRYLFGHIQLGSQGRVSEMIAGQRKTSRGILAREDLANHTLESLAAGQVEANQELFSNSLVTWLEQNVAEPHDPGTTIPEGYKPWDPARQYILTGTDGRGDFKAVNARYIIPEHYDRAISSLGQSYDHWTFHTLTKVTQPWLTMNLSLSPKWYIHVFVSNAVRLMADGVGPLTMLKAIKAWKSGTIPDEVMNHSISNLMADGTHTLLGSSIKDAMQTEGLKQAMHEVRGRMAKVHDVSDEIGRAAVYMKSLDRGLSREQAITHMYEALVDYGNMSPFERGVIRSVVPFYPFYKGMVKLLARFPADHPMATTALLILGQMHEEELKQQFNGVIPSAYLGTADIFGFHNFTMFDPFITPTNLVDIHNINTTLNPFVDVMLRDAYNAAEPGAGVKGISATGTPVTQENPAQALGQTFAGMPVVRLLAQAVGGGDVYKKDPGLVGGIAQYLGAPTSPNMTNVANNTAKALGLPQQASSADINTLIQQALAKKPAKARKPLTFTQKEVRAAVRRIRGTGHSVRTRRARSTMKVRMPSIRAKGTVTHHTTHSSGVHGFTSHTFHPASGVRIKRVRRKG